MSEKIKVEILPGCVVEDNSGKPMKGIHTLPIEEASRLVKLSAARFVQEGPAQKSEPSPEPVKEEESSDREAATEDKTEEQVEEAFPDTSWNKADIISFMQKNEIPFKTNDTKEILVNACIDWKAAKN